MLSLARSDWEAAKLHFRSALDDEYLEGFGFFESKYGVSIPTHIGEMLYPPADYVLQRQLV